MHQGDVQAVVNALWAGGAEAMSIMDVRVLSTSAVRCVGNTLLLHGRVYSPPFKIVAIGDPAALQQALASSEGVRLFKDAVDHYQLGYNETVATVRRSRIRGLDRPAFGDGARMSRRRTSVATGGTGDQTRRADRLPAQASTGPSRRPTAARRQPARAGARTAREPEQPPPPQRHADPSRPRPRATAVPTAATLAGHAAHRSGPHGGTGRSAATTRRPTASSPGPVAPRPRRRPDPTGRRAASAADPADTAGPPTPAGLLRCRPPSAGRLADRADPPVAARAARPPARRPPRRSRRSHRRRYPASAHRPAPGRARAAGPERWAVASRSVPGDRAGSAPTAASGPGPGPRRRTRPPPR